MMVIAALSELGMESGLILSVNMNRIALHSSDFRKTHFPVRERRSCKSLIGDPGVIEKINERTRSTLESSSALV